MGNFMSVEKISGLNLKYPILLPDGMRTVSFYISTSSGQKIFFDGWDTYNPVAWMPLPRNYLN